MMRQVFASSHPGPSVAVTALAAILGLAVGLPPVRVLVLALVVFVGQLSIGWSNDWLDARRDRATKRTDKPLAVGAVSLATVRAAAVVSLVLSVPLSFAIGTAAGLAHLLFVVCGWAYNLGLKSTPVSVVPFLIGFGALPAVVTLAAPPPIAPAPWTLLVGALFGTAVHFTNALPDLEDDLRTGVRGLPHRLGAKVAGWTAFAALGSAGIVTLLGQSGVSTGTLSPPPPVGVLGTLILLALVAWGVRLVATKPPDRVLFRVVIAAAVLLAVELAVAGTALGAVSTS
ncbi:UbiA family prenyltransferase [Plantibacter flavus]|uniref:UbiA family prenyltransferase n=1 Tax=Plantibacter flavus TaxID=150123 RepID=UPI003F153F11